MAEQRSNIAAVAGARDKNSSSLVGTRPSTQSSKKKTKQMAKGTDLKSKEEEYRKMNEELEARAASLLKEADTFLMRDTESLLFENKLLGTDTLEQKKEQGFGPTEHLFSSPLQAQNRMQPRTSSATGTKPHPSPPGSKLRPNTETNVKGKTKSDRSAVGSRPPKPKVIKSVESVTRDAKTSEKAGHEFGLKVGTQQQVETSFGIGSAAGERDGEEKGAVVVPSPENRPILGTLGDSSLITGVGESGGLAPPRDVHYYDDILPEVAEGVGSEALIRILKAKLRVMQEEMDRLNGECKEKDKMISRSDAKMSELASEQTRLKKAQQSLMLQIDKQKQLVDELKHKNDSLEAQVSGLKKELDGKERLHKQLMSNQSTTDVRLNRALEEVEKYKSALQQARTETKDVGEQEKRKFEKVSSDNKRLEKQRNDLITAFKKQQKMIDILKRQKMHLEAAKVLSFTEEEFVKALDWGTQ